MPRTLQFSEVPSTFLPIPTHSEGRNISLGWVRISVCFVQEKWRYENIKQKEYWLITHERPAIRVVVNRMKGNTEESSSGWVVKMWSKCTRGSIYIQKTSMGIDTKRTLKRWYNTYLRIFRNEIHRTIAT